jgi:hypothetical protein
VSGWRVFPPATWRSRRSRTGYAEALAGDAWLTDNERRLHELIDDASLAARGRELRL